MLDLLIPHGTTRVVIYRTPIDTRYGPDKLRALCREVLRIEPDEHTAFVFTNRRRDTLVLYVLDDSGDRTLTKKLERGGFILPAPDASGSEVATLKPSMLGKLFR